MSLSVVDCYRHPGVAGTNTCGVCLQPVCDTCLGWVKLEPACPVCARKKRRRASALTAGVVLAALFLCGGAGLAAFLVYEPAFEYGQHAPKVLSLSARLEDEPCDREAIVQLGETLVRARDYRGALRRTDDWLAECGDYSRLRWVRYSAYKFRGDLDGAIREATRLIEEDPDDKDFWWWRGLMYEQQKEYAKAIADYEKSIEIQPALSNIPFNLSSMYERMGRPCEAIRPVEQFLVYHPESLGTADVKHRLTRLRSACAKPDGGDAIVDGRVEFHGASIRLPDGFVPLAPGWDKNLGRSDHAVPGADVLSKAFLRITEKGDAIVQFRVIDVSIEGREIGPIEALPANLERKLRGSRAVSHTADSTRSDRLLDARVSFEREHNGGELRVAGGFLPDAPVVRYWVVQCEERPPSQGSLCANVARSLQIADARALRPFRDVYVGMR